MSEKIKVFNLGGLDENGKNCTVIEIDNKIFVVGCGIKVPDKTTPGIDYIIINPQYLIDNKDRIAAYILLHGHDDECGALTFVYDSAPAPIYCSEATRANFIKFADHVKKLTVHFDFKVIEATSVQYISGIRFNFFHTCHNIKDSSGVAIETSLGNIVFMGDYIIENNAEADYLFDLKALSKIAEKPTLLLLIESGYSDRLGYTAPKHKLQPIVFKNFEEARGRIFVSLYATNQYNFYEIIKLAQQYKRKIICYDLETKDLFDAFLYTIGQTNSRNLIVPLDDINRVNESELIILMSGYSDRIFDKVKALAEGTSDEKRVVLKPSDLFIHAAPSNLTNEIIATEAIDSLYLTGATIRNITSKEFYTMHASEEDIKMVISLLRPRYYMPIKGSFRQLLSNGQLAISMGVKLNYNNIFILDNGNVLSIDEKGAHIEPTAVKTGELLVDGFGITDSNSTVVEERQQLGADGIVIIATTVSKKQRKIIAGPDIQMRGFIFLKDADSILRSLQTILSTTLDEYLNKTYINLDEARQIIRENSLKTIRRETGKSPIIFVPIIELD